MVVAGSFIPAMAAKILIFPDAVWGWLACWVIYLLLGLGLLCFLPLHIDYDNFAR